MGSDQGQEDCNSVKKALADRFLVTARPDENIQKAMSCRQNASSLLTSMDGMDKLYSKAGFNDEAKYGLFCNAVIEHLDAAQVAIYRSQKTYEELKIIVQDFSAGRDAFKAARSSARSGELPSPKRILTRSDTDPREEKLENKFDATTSQLAELSLMMKKRQTPGDSATGWTCSYCKEPGHSPNRCHSNPHRNTHCPTCGNVGHAAETFWSRLAARGAPRERSQGSASDRNSYSTTPVASVNNASGETTRDSKQVTDITEATKRRRRGLAKAVEESRRSLNSEAA